MRFDMGTCLRFRRSIDLTMHLSLITTQLPEITRRGLLR